MTFVIIIVVAALLLFLLTTSQSKESFQFTNFVKAKSKDYIDEEMAYYKATLRNANEDAEHYMAAKLLAEFNKTYQKELLPLCEGRINGTYTAQQFITATTVLIQTTAIITMKDWRAACQELGDFAVQHGYSSNDFILMNTATVAALMTTYDNDHTASDASTDSGDGGGGE
ncbi:hypothetical protein GCM10007425_12040 [Lysinibacillus alkalisoli]|uniref:Uncharacterized protein n=1 Tax=Lysinibacillus alkalisoli TaxID=1911548 RepID=A0A917G212_9BACI|nr:hypothetical protein [Lysinibacillus alkalisoli]GGG19098.1 hypothetical protein GCM10007425_12040 [Lysinibacillus alkalisoli]